MKFDNDAQLDLFAEVFTTLMDFHESALLPDDQCALMTEALLERFSMSKK